MVHQFCRYMNCTHIVIMEWIPPAFLQHGVIVQSWWRGLDQSDEVRSECNCGAKIHNGTVQNMAVIECKEYCGVVISY